MKFLLKAFLAFFLFAFTTAFSQTYTLTTAGGNYATEKWVSITTGSNGSGTQVWGQGNGTYGNGSGLLTDESINLSAYVGQTLYLNCYDSHDDGWDGTTYTLKNSSGTTVASGSPNDGNDTDASGSFESGNMSAELEASVSFTVEALAPVSLPYAESFESGFGIWSTSGGSPYVWTERSGSTPSGSTGPTGAQAGSDYLFVEASSSTSGADAYLTATFNFADYAAPEMTFYYHMFGAETGDLKVQVDDGSGFTTISTISGQQQTASADAWLQQTVDLSAYGSSQVDVRIWAESAGSYRGDISIDNIEITNQCTPPATQASGLVFSNVSLSNLDISWSRGSGDGVIVTANEGSAPSDPEIGTTYSANALYGSGDALTSGFVIYEGTGTSVSLSGLTDGTTYHVSVYEYASTGTCYNTTELTGSQATLSYDADADVNTPATQVAATTISSVNNDAIGESMEVFKFTIEDGGTADGVATKVTKVRVTPGASNTADWTDNIQGASLTFNGVSVITSSVDITDTYIDFNIAEGNLNVADGDASKEAAVSIYLNSSNIQDGAVIQMMVDADNHGFTKGSASSSFPADLVGDVVGNNITIDVTATALNYAAQPSNTLLNQNMSDVTVEAVDANGNRDTDFVSQIDITSTGTLSTSPQSASAVAGLATFSAINHTAAGTSLTLNVERNGTGDWDVTSSTFDITETPDICTDAIDIYGLTASLNMANANNDYADGETDAGSETSFTMGDWNTLYPCNTGSYHSAYYYTDFKDLWVKLDIPAGTDEFTIDVTNWSGSGYAYFLPYYGTCGSLTQMTISGASGVTSNNTPDLTGNGSITFSGTDVQTGSNSTIFLRIFMHDNSVSAGSVGASCATLSYPSFDITASAPQPNDTDGDAIEISGTSSSGNLCLAAIEAESTETGDNSATDCGASGANDLWYKITSGGSDPTTQGKVSVTFDGASDAVVVTEFWGAFSSSYEECVTLTSTGAGSTVSHTFADQIPAGSTNYYRVTPVSGNSVCSFTIEGAQVVPNDDCSEFESLVTGYDIGGASRDANFEFASASGVNLPDGTSGASTKDLYYNFSSTGGTLHGTYLYSGKADITLSGISTGTYTLAVYKRNPTYTPCAGLTSNLVSSITGINSNRTVSMCLDIQEGDYLVRLIQTAGTDETVTLSASPSAVAPLNSEGTYLANNTSSSQTTFNIISNSFTGEDFSRDNDGCESVSLSDNGGHTTNSGKDLWYTFTMPSDPGCDPTVSEVIEGITVDYASVGGTGYVHLELYTSIADGGYVAEASILAASGTATFNGLSYSTRYYLRVKQHSITNTDQFDISAAYTNPIPCYDDPVNAIDLTGNFSGGPCPRDGSLTDYSMKNAHAEGGRADEDVWFKFTQPNNADEDAFTHIRLSNEGPSFRSMTVELWESADGVTPAAEVESTGTTSNSTYDEVFINTGGLTASATYFIRIVLKEPLAETDEALFNICIFDDNGGHFDFVCPTTDDGNIEVSKSVECDDLSGVKGDCNRTYRLNLRTLSPTAWYRIEVLSNEPIEVPQIYGQGNNLNDYDNPCNRMGVGNQVESSGDIADPNAECTGATHGKWVTLDMIGSGSFESNIYNLWVGSTSATGCWGLDICEINIEGPYASQAHAEGGVIGNVNSLYCSYFDYGDLDGGLLYPEVYGIYTDTDGNGYPDDGVWLGSTIDAENNSVANGDVTGDDTDGTDDEDGVTLLTQGSPGGTATIRVVGNAEASGTTVHVGVWIDWHGNGFQAEDFYTGSGVTASPVNIDIDVDVPADFESGDEAKMMVKAGKSPFVFSSASDNVINGEIEGHKMSFDDMILPIELLEFNGENKGNYNHITWVTGSQENTDYFVLEKSTNGMNFSDFKQLEGAGTTMEILDYEVVDENPAEVTYYRLKDVDFNGDMHYSSVITVLAEEAMMQTVAFDCYPNPTNGDQVQIAINAHQDQVSNLVITNLLGEVVYTNTFALRDGMTNATLDLNHLSQGTYLVTLQGKYTSFTSRIQIQK